MISITMNAWPDLIDQHYKEEESMSQMSSVVNGNVSEKKLVGVSKADLHNKRLQSLDKGKTKSLGFIEKSAMKYAGWVDGRKGLLRCDTDGVWQSSVLKQEVDSYEEFCAEQMGVLKLDEEDEFRQMNVLFDAVIPLRKKLSDAKEKLRKALAEEVDLSVRKEGEENLTEVQVVARRTRERDEMLQPFKDTVARYDKELSDTVDAIFASLSQVKESFDSTVKITNRVLQHSQRRIDVYWRSAMRYMSDLPALPDVVFSNKAEQAFAGHYDKVAARAEKLRMELASELYGEEM